MIPIDDWMIVELYEKQAAQLDVQLALPDTVDKFKDENAVFKVVKMGPKVNSQREGEQAIKVGDVVILYGFDSIHKLQVPSKKRYLVTRGECAIFVLEEEDLR